MPRFFQRSTLLLSTALLGVVLMLGGCDSLTELDSVTLNGRVIDQNGSPVQNALVDLVANQFVRQARTDSVGTYKFTFEISDAVEQNQQQQQQQQQDEAVTVSVEASFGAAVSNNISKLVSSGQSYTMRDLQITIDSSTGGSGTDTGNTDNASAASITLTPESIQEVSVSGAGGSEIAQIGFVVYDANGLPLSDVSVEASIDARPTNAAGDADNSFLAPNTTDGGRSASNVTNSEGIATFTFTSGTVAGTAQLVAIVPDALNPSGNPVRTQPVTIVVQSGLPNEEHFSVGLDEPNKPCLNEINCEIGVVAVVGDAYSNPAREGTPVYLEADFGLVESQTFTDDLGRASGTFVTGNPFPPDGIAYLRARTNGTRAGGGTQEQISTQTQFLLTGQTRVGILSGPTFIDDYVISGDTLNPGSAFDGVPDSIQDTVVVRAAYAYRVADRNNNPLTKGTAITVTAEGTNVEAFGATTVNIDDFVTTPGPNGATDFSFSAKASDRTSDELPYLDLIGISVSSGNGNVDFVQEAFIPLYRVEDR